MFALMRHIAIVSAALSFALSLVSTANAQTAEKYPYLAAITADQTSVRAGADSRYYAFGSVQKNDLVKVVAQKAGWARIRTQGPAFDKFFGYLKFPKTEADRFRVSDKGKEGLTLGPTNVFAPNLDENGEPARSWKPIVQLPAQTKLNVIETNASALHVVYKVQLPKAAEGWIDMAHLKRASLEQIAVWDKAMQRPRPMTGAEEPEEIIVQRPAPEQTPTPPPTTDQITTQLANVDQDTNEPPRPIEISQAPPVVTNIDTSRADAASDPMPDTQAKPTTPPEVERPNQILGNTQLPEASVPRVQKEDVPQDVIVLPQTKEQTEEEWIDQLDISGLTLEVLEGKYQRLLREPLETAEVVPLRRLYAAFAREHSGTDIVAEHLGTRVEQLQIWGELQEQVVALNQMRKRNKGTSAELDVVVEALKKTDEYVVVGRLAASTIYDGQRLPRLFRLRDPATGRTVGYVRPNLQVNLPEMLGQLIGVVGEKSYDGGLRLNLVTPRRIDILKPRPQG